MRTPSDLVADLRRLGVVEGDLLMVHASLRRIGAVERGAAGVVRALDQAVGMTGTYVAVAYPGDESPFHIDAPASIEVGVLSEVIRRTPGTVVNDHPDGRFAVRGALAQWLVEPTPWDDYYGPDSLLDRFQERRGKVLRMGADLNTVTLLHLAEYLCDVPEKRRVVRHHQLLRDDGSIETRTMSALDDDNGIALWNGEDYFATIVEAYLAQREAAVDYVGDATSELMESQPLLAFAIDWMNQYLGGNGRTS